MPSPSVELNSTSLGGWTAMADGVDVAAGEVVSVRLADSAGLKLWQLAIFGTDHRVGAPTITQASTAAGVATFTAPATPAEGWSLLFQSTVGVNALGKDLFDRAQDSYTATFGVFLPTSSGARLVATNQTTEGSTEFGWTVDVNTAILAGTSATTGEINQVRVPWKGSARFVITGNVSNLAAFTVAQSEGTAVAADRLLLSGQTTASQNGLYVVGTVGGGTAPLTRATDMSTSADTIPGSRVSITEGVLYKNSEWYLATSAPITLGVTSLSFVQVDVVVNVMRFGATGGGVVSDQAAIQSAIAALPSAGGALYFPPGKTYLLDNSSPYGLQMSYKDKVKIFSDGAGATIQMVKDTNGLNIYGCNDLEMYGLRWVGTLQTDGGDPLGLPGRATTSNINQSAVLISQCRGVNIHDTQWEDLGGYAIFILDHVFNIKMTNLTCLRTHAGIQTSSSAVYGPVFMSDCYLEGNVWQTPDTVSGRSLGSDDQLYFCGGRVGSLSLNNITIDKQGFYESNVHYIISASQVNGNIVTERHNFPVGKSIRLIANGSIPTGFVENRTYYTLAPAGGADATITFRLSETPGGSAIVPSSTYTGLLIAQPVNDGSSNEATAIDIQVSSNVDGGDTMQDIILNNITVKNVRSTRTVSNPDVDLRQDFCRAAIQILGDTVDGNVIQNLKMTNVTVRESNQACVIWGPGINDIAIKGFHADNIWGLPGTHGFVEEDGLAIGPSGACARVSLEDVTIKAPADFGLALGNITGLSMDRVFVYGVATYAKTVTADNTTERFTCANHNFLPCHPVIITSSGSLPAGLSAGKLYVIQGDLTDLEFKDKFYLAADLTNALAGTWVTFTTDGTGVLTATRQINDVGGGNAGINLTSCVNTTLTDSLVDGMTGAAIRVIACVDTIVHDTICTNNGAYIQLITSGNGKLHDNLQRGNTSTTITDTTGGAWQMYNNTSAGGTSAQTDFTGTAKLSGLGSGVVHSSGAGLLSSSAVVDADFTGTLTVSKLAPGTSGQILRSNSTPTSAWATAAGDWSGDPTTNVVVGLTGTAGTVAMHGTKILWDSSGPSVEVGGPFSTGLVLKAQSTEVIAFYNQSNNIGYYAWNSGNTLYRCPAGATTFSILADQGTSQYIAIRVSGTTPQGLYLDAANITFQTGGAVAKGTWNNNGLRIGDSATAASGISLTTLGDVVSDSGAYFRWVTANTQSTVGAAGGASGLPATPTGYAKISINGSVKVVPYYDAS